jgi:hypothetical protein
MFSAADRSDVIERDITTLPGVGDMGLFRVEAKRYRVDHLERVLAIARPTA